jgi:hypothetical protein
MRATHTDRPIVNRGPSPRFFIASFLKKKNALSPGPSGQSVRIGGAPGIFEYNIPIQKVNFQCMKSTQIF